MTSVWQGLPYFRSYARELASKPAIWSKKNWGGYRKTTPKWEFHLEIDLLRTLDLSFTVAGCRIPPNLDRRDIIFLQRLRFSSAQVYAKIKY